jgi:hypothetical protein
MDSSTSNQLLSTFSSSNVSISFLLSNNDDFIEKKFAYTKPPLVSSEPIKRKVYNSDGKNRKSKRSGSLDREALDRYKYFKSLCSIKQSSPSSYNNKDQEKSVSTEHLRRYFEDLSNHETPKFTKENINFKFNDKKNYKENITEINSLRRSSRFELKNNLNQISSSDSSIFQTSIQKVASSNYLCQNIEVKPLDKFPIKKENSLNGILPKMKSVKFKFSQLDKPLNIEKNLTTEDFDLFERNDDSQYQGLTRQNRIIFFDESKQNKKTKDQQQINKSTSSNYQANLPYLPKEVDVTQKKDSLTEDNLKLLNGKHNLNRHAILDTLSVITEEDSEYFQLKSPINSRRSNMNDIPSVSQNDLTNDVAKKVLIFLAPTSKQRVTTTTFVATKNVSPLIKSKMSMFEISKIDKNMIKSSYDLPVKFNTTKCSTVRLKNFNDER